MIYIGMPNCLKSLPIRLKVSQPTPKGLRFATWWIFMDMSHANWGWMLSQDMLVKMEQKTWPWRAHETISHLHNIFEVASFCTFLSTKPLNQQLCSKNNAIPRSISEGSRYSQGLWQPMGRGWKTVSTLDSFYNVWQHGRMKSDSFIMDSHEGLSMKTRHPGPKLKLIDSFGACFTIMSSLRLTESFSSYFPVVLFWFFQPPWA